MVVNIPTSRYCGDISRASTIKTTLPRTVGTSGQAILTNWLYVIISEMDQKP
ncbi:MAG TPA: hypothetical protein VJ225_02665 [Nitrososphaeraceae archaeon]|nr:hypothetical protein [Nitrososphaeraceae archaeon]